MHLLLHIGSAKTGTTAVQNGLWHNRDLLIGSGVLMLQSFGAPNARGLYVCAETQRLERPAHLDLGLHSTADIVRYRGEVIRQLALELAGSSAQHCFVSNEGLWTLGPQDIAGLKSMPSEYFDEVQLLVYLRRQDRKAVSNYSTQLRNLGRRVKPLDLSRSRPERYLRKLGNWVDVFGEANLTLRVYEEAVANCGSVLVDVAQLLRLEAAQLDVPVARSNPPIGRETQELMRILNEQGEIGQDVDFRQWLVALSEAGIDKSIPLRPSRADAERFYQRVKDENDEIARVVLGLKKLFDESFESYPETAVLSPAPVDIVKHALGMLSRAYFSGNQAPGDTE